MIKEALSRLSIKILIVIGVVFAAMLLALWVDLDDRVYSQWFSSPSSDASRTNAVWLHDYQANLQRKKVAGVEKNLSGITFNPDSGTLWVIINQPQQLIELDADLVPLRTIMLENFSDTEAVAYAGNNTFVIADERDHTIAVATVDRDTRWLDRNELPRITLKLGGSENKGLEGVAIDPKTNLIYAVQERNPLKLITVTGLIDGKPGIEIGVPTGINVNELYLDDLSGLHFDSETGHLLILSHEAKLLAEVNMDGQKISYIDLEAGFNGLTDDIPQAEGVTLDSDGNLYIVSEPNLIYRFSKEHQ